MFTRIELLSNTLGQHYHAYRGGPVLPSPAQLETILGGSIGPLTGDVNGGGAPVEHKPNVPPSDPLNTTVFMRGLSPLISEETLRTFFAPFGAIHYVKLPPSKSCGFVQYVRQGDAEQAIEALGGSPIGGSKVRLSWGRIPAAQVLCKLLRFPLLQTMSMRLTP
ncbi:hypothetical protein M408DRAFT_301926 [Serendipita vermifera MAFF 305830]|uniref:RRM domain-containing protein n=1 Tax=Serendipita vermifera MAFF 305830 TaxID=933852 RepID=A0A0C2W5H8_SERVB|nr:hypothetical protein M408DRAFT_301926 [Serendipita vermifera MAFF 305830]